jgi:hypothetical protein
MKRIIFVPQYPTPLRYQEWWYWKFPQEFKKAGYEVYTLGEKSAKYNRSGIATKGMFSPIEAAIKFETDQIREYMTMDIRDDDTLFLADISFPGFFTNVLYHKKPNKAFAYCHATSINKYDYFENVWHSKSMVETGHSRMFDKIFLGSWYHQQKLGWGNTYIIKLPFPPLERYCNLIPDKSIEICSASRPTRQKVDMELEKHFKIIRRNEIKDFKDTWEDYYSFLSMSKILLISAFEDTFGYQIVDAVMNNCIPLAPNRCSYPEIIPRQYIYDDLKDLKKKIKLVNDGKLKVPSLICEGEMKMFYENIIDRME